MSIHGTDETGSSNRKSTRRQVPRTALLHPYGEAGYAVRAAVPREVLPSLIPLLRERGGTDVRVSLLEQIVP